MTLLTGVSKIVTIVLCGLGIGNPRMTVGLQVEHDQESSHRSAPQKTFLTWQIFYALAVLFSKLAILLLYLRVFTSAFKSFAYTIYLLGIAIFVTGAIDISTSFLYCAPSPKSPSDSTSPQKCVNQLAFQYYLTIPNIVTGFIMLIIPLPVVWRLKITMVQKIGLTLTFLHGGIGFLGSCARLFALSKAMHANEPSWIALTIWTINEPANYLIAACLPTLRPIFSKCLPESFFILSRASRSKSRSSNGGPRSNRSDSNPQMIKCSGSWQWPWGRKSSSRDISGASASDLKLNDFVRNLRSGIRGVFPSMITTSSTSHDEPLASPTLVTDSHTTFSTYNEKGTASDKIRYNVSEVDVEAQNSIDGLYKDPVTTRTVVVNEREVARTPAGEDGDSWLKV